LNFSPIWLILKPQFDVVLSVEQAMSWKKLLESASLLSARLRDGMV
jgi:hypothetical protein